jgi:hypothetical protein
MQYCVRFASNVWEKKFMSASSFTEYMCLLAWSRNTIACKYKHSGCVSTSQYKEKVMSDEDVIRGSWGVVIACWGKYRSVQLLCRRNTGANHDEWISGIQQVLKLGILFYLLYTHANYSRKEEFIPEAFHFLVRRTLNGRTYAPCNKTLTVWKKNHARFIVGCVSWSMEVWSWRYWLYDSWNYRERSREGIWLCVFYLCIKKINSEDL